MLAISQRKTTVKYIQTLLLAASFIALGIFYNFIANIIGLLLVEIFTNGHAFTRYGHSLSQQCIALIPEWILLLTLGWVCYSDYKHSKHKNWHITSGLFSFGYVAGIPLILFIYYLYYSTMHPYMIDSIYLRERAIFGTGMSISRASFPEILIAFNALKLTCIPVYFFGCWMSIKFHSPKPILPVCSSCQYNLSGTIAANRNTCPECGNEISPEQMALDIDLNKQIGIQ